MLNTIIFIKMNVNNTIFVIPSIFKMPIVGKYLAGLLYPLTTNEYSLKDYFDAANRIKDISLHLFENGFQ